ncbi:Asp-tRNA(Asn)/Glu-tRNA(Gln) amidotransferase subunit GatC [Calditerrivibrio nitroreducens]|uniref:Aspartyl/glutamyl-tRNA(Asn/Gln) amidotransferase subunit C n=1 Tax=Calditerrivibrio nitroreducens (strain DSM 19672 / NBRC 101217 / Yu37-1) TaxID=768670 RepID=E4TIH3_CALNY|nr:Asp-tRNA(Asn)/Glu-tRNA(Gln) amidotransferase subunit GatC [Calditerrivibrio nitroreducens]ADR17998.1 aspartyl/glutamyl-tRNA(Asn/Gln) amidotransferase subunit C [Calditerrivibrio nitroreducens DSM 19672]
MNGIITEDNVKHIAKLSKLTFEDKEIGRFVNELNSILDYINKLNELDTSDVEPTSHALDLTNVTRPDIPERVITREEALQNAPDEGYNHFKVPRIIE